MHMLFPQDVRGANEIDFSFNITYREFTAEMLTELISHSLNCSQYIKYDCYKAPLDLHSATWFVSAAGQGTTSTVDFIGNVKRGACPCAGNHWSYYDVNMSKLILNTVSLLNLLDLS